MTAPTLLERAFELARSGEFTSVAEIRARLKVEGYDPFDIQGKALHDQLKRMMIEAKRLPAVDEPSAKIGGEPKPTSKDVANWMLEQVKEHGALKRQDALREIPKLFGDGFVLVSPSTKKSFLVESVRRAFAKMKTAKVYWERTSEQWRSRTRGKGSSQ